ncbi:MAG: FHA domain-containing protein [Deltaproteobacteria bacterium]|nr:FHA domain-containing protein [Deltaproteobacteria bacterium]MBW2076297.1 FHA domain-containing protein [Deltaproteobacteria bacterium]MBW2311258.1 FHA domain-containing protein [Deltaproteobacteria bacterium]
MPKLTIIHDDGTSQTVVLDKATTSIGRDNDNDLPLLERTISRHHAQIKRTKEGYILTDLGSYNGTLVNGNPVQSVILKHNDRIKIGLKNLVFLDEKKGELSPEESLVLTTDADFEEEHKQIIESFSQSGSFDSQELLVSIEEYGSPMETEISALPEKTEDESKIKSDLSSLERSNKVLFVLYEISRHLNTLLDFRELLKKIMDLIFIVIDADYGFLILTEDENRDKLVPVVVKTKGDREIEKGKLCASRTIIEKVIRDKVAVLTSNAMADSRFNGAKSLFLQQIRSAMCVPLWRKEKIIGVIQLDSIRLDNQFVQDDLELLKAIGSQMAMVIEQASLNEQIKEEEMMRSRLERFHSPQVIEMILRGGQETKDNVMEANEVTATMLFTDIVGFTRLAEQISPRETNIILNRYFSAMTDVVFSYDGTLDKYIGDGLMAVFGAPMERDDDAERAILAAKDMREKLTAMMTEKGSSSSTFDIRIGINTGRVVAGNIGSPRRMDYTVIGDPVNIAARLESIAEPNQILIGEETYKTVKGKFEIREIGRKRVKGKSEEIMVYEVL